MTQIDLLKPVSGGLGFSVVGLCSENRGDLGIFIQEIQAGSVAHRSEHTHTHTHTHTTSQKHAQNT